MGETDSSITGASDTAPSITSQAYARLRADILAGRLAPGAKLKIDDLRQRLGTGASPVREALSLLTSDHFVERIDQRGFRVARVSEDGFAELLATRAWLEERALRESIANGGNDWEEGIVLAHYHLSRTPRTASDDDAGSNGSTSSEWEQRHREFHFSLLRACGSAILLRFCNQLYDQNIRYRHLAQRAGERASGRRNIADEHARIQQATLDRDADAAVNALLSHFRSTGAALSRHIS